jgi:hypothetical protein
MDIKLVVVALLAGTSIAIAQPVAPSPSPPDPLARPAAPDLLVGRAAPTTSQARDGVRNGTTKEERDQHSEPRPGSIDKPIPERRR